MSQPPAKKALLTELESLRAFGILAVIMIHATSSSVVNSDPNSTLFLILVLFNTLSKFAVPLFILISGISLFYNYNDKPLNKQTAATFYKKRITKILLPFLLFSFIYYATIIYFRYGFTSFEQFISYFQTWDFFIKLMIGKTYAHLYFIFIIIQCYLLFPLLWCVMRKWPRLVNWMITGGLLIQWAYMLNAKEMGIKYVTSGFFAYSLYFCIGAYIGINYTKLLSYWERKRSSIALRTTLIVVLAISGAINVIYFMREAQGKTLINQIFLVQLKNEIYITAACLLLIHVALRIKVSRMESLKTVLIHLSHASFGIYLLHPMFLRYYRMMDVNGSPLVYGAWIAGGFLLALIGSWIIVTWAGKVKGHWILFGPIPKQKSLGQ